MGYRGDDASRARQQPWRPSNRHSGDGYDGGYDGQQDYGSNQGYDPYNGASPDAYRQQRGYGSQGGHGHQSGDGYGYDPYGGSGGRPDNDWYGGRGGAGFADTSAVVRPANLPMPGYLNGGGQDRLAIEASPPDRLAQTRQQDVLDDRQYAGYPGYDNVDDPYGRGGADGYGAPGYADDYDDYADYTPDYAVSAPTTVNPAYVEPAPTTANPGFAAADYDAPGEFGAGGDGFGDGFGDDFDGQPAYGGDQYDGYAEELGAAATGVQRRPRPGKGGKKGKGGKRPKAAKKGRKAIVYLASLGSVAVAATALYFTAFKSSSPSDGANAPLPSPGSTGAATVACQKQLGTYCHIQSRASDPAPLTVGELFPPVFLNEKDKLSYSRIGTKTDKTCSNAVIGTDLTNAVGGNACSQVLRASYTSGKGKDEIMGTIGVINFSTVNQAHKAGKLIGANNFLAPLSTSKGVGANLGQSTGVVMSQFKGHYLILTWAELAQGMQMSGQPSDAQNKLLERFESDLVADTANIDLSQRMVTGKPPASGNA